MKTNIPSPPSSSSTPAHAKSRSKWRKSFPFAIVSAALVTPWIAGQLPVTKAGPDSYSGAIDWTGHPQKVRKELEEATTIAAKAEAVVWRKFEGKLEAVGEQNRRDLAGGVQSAVERVVQTGEVGLLITDFAQDKVLGGSRASDRVQSCSSGFTQSLKDSSARVACALDGLRQELESVNNRYAMTVGDIIKRECPSLPPADFRHLEELGRKIPQKVSLQVTSTAVAVIFEAISIGVTKEAIGKIVVLLAEKLAPQIAKATVGVGAAVVDGPLPIGDILTVALAAWTVYDVFSLPGAIREDVRGAFQEAGERHLSNLNEQAKTMTGNLAQKSRESRENLQRELLAALNR